MRHLAFIERLFGSRESYNPYGGFKIRGVALNEESFHTKSGQKLDFEFYEYDPYDHKGVDWGWRNLLFVARISGLPVGYLKVTIYQPAPAQKLDESLLDIIGIPLMSYIDVDPSKYREGIATSLYIVTARWLAKSGKMLFSSGLSGHAPLVWQKMLSDGLPVRIREKGDSATVNYVLDFTS